MEFFVQNVGNLGPNPSDPTKPNSYLFCENKPVLDISDGPELVRKSYSRNDIGNSL